MLEELFSPVRRDGAAVGERLPGDHRRRGAPVGAMVEGLGGAGLPGAVPGDVPADPGVWSPSAEVPDGLPPADGMQVLWDLRRTPGSDVDQAVEVLREVLRARAASAAGAR